MRFVANGDDLVLTPDHKLRVRTAFGSWWVMAVFGDASERRFGHESHDISDEEWSQLANVSLIQRVNPLTDRFNRINVRETDYGNGYRTLTLY
jgi:hypothetical protein